MPLDWQDVGYDQDPTTDELAYGRCKECGQLDELNADDLCYICEGINEPKYSSKKLR